MTELTQHIEASLLENECVIVPGFGGFVTHYAPARYIKEENLFLPPTRTIGFNSQLKLNDGILVQSYMSVHDTCFPDATRMVERDVAALVGLLHEEGKARLENIGEIHYNIYGNYEFLPYDGRIANPSLYGLDSFEMQEIVGLQRKEKVLSPIHPAKEKRTYEISINRAFVRNAAALIAGIILFFAFSTPIENTDIQKNNYAQLLPFELFKQIEKQSVVTTPVPVKTTATQHTPQSSLTTEHKKAMVGISQPIAVKEIKVARPQEAPVSTVALPQVNHPFHIIVLGGIALKDAEAMTDQLKSKGFAEARTLTNDGKIRVSIRSFDNREEATKQLLELRKDENYKNAWLLAK